MTREEKAKAAWQKVKEIIFDTIKDCQDPTFGTPSGPMYAALMGHISLDIYDKMISELIAEGKIRQSNYCLFVVDSK